MWVSEVALRLSIHGEADSSTSRRECVIEKAMLTHSQPPGSFLPTLPQASNWTHALKSMISPLFVLFLPGPAPYNHYTFAFTFCSWFPHTEARWEKNKIGKRLTSGTGGSIHAAAWGKVLCSTAKTLAATKECQNSCSTADGDCSHEIKTLVPWKKSYDKPRQHIKKQRHHFANKCPSSQSYGFSSSGVWMWERDHEKGWAPKNWCFQIVVLEKTLESPLDCKEIEPVSPKGNEPWIFTGRTDAETEALTLWPPDANSWLTGKDPDSGKDWGQEKKRVTEDELVRWHHWFNGHEFQQTLGEVKYGEAWRAPWGSKELDMTDWLNSNNYGKILSGTPAWYEEKNEPQGVPEWKWTGEDNICKIFFLIAN